MSQKKRQERKDKERDNREKDKDRDKREKDKDRKQGRDRRPREKDTVINAAGFSFLSRPPPSRAIAHHGQQRLLRTSRVQHKR